ncbi:MAG: TetR/AcrR family transcriptional regulator [Bacteroidota bacterium]
MNQEEPNKDTHSKVEVILQAAQRRLGLYGYEKTTMKEIADDILMSKASLYYYFTDKDAIFKAVVEKEQKEFSTRIETKIAELDDPEEMVKVFIDQRMKYFREFMNLSKFRSTEPEQVKPLLKELFFRFRMEEQKLLVKILKIGKNSGLFHCENEELYADLFLNIVKGLRFSLIQQKPYIELAPVELEVLVKAFHDFTALFIRGLKYNESN